MKLQAGFSRLDMTPPLGAYMDGYYFDRWVEGVQDMQVCKLIRDHLSL